MFTCAAFWSQNECERLKHECTGCTKGCHPVEGDCAQRLSLPWRKVLAQLLAQGAFSTSQRGAQHRSSLSAMPRACFFACARGALTPARCRASREGGSARRVAARVLRVRNGHETLSASPRTESEAADSQFVHSSRFRAALILQICDASSKGQFRRSSEKCTLAGGVHTSRFFTGSRRKRARVARIRPQPPVSCRLRAEGRCFVAGSDAQRFRFGIW